jgi:hypothetical protein
VGLSRVIELWKSHVVEGKIVRTVSFVGKDIDTRVHQLMYCYILRFPDIQT